MRPIFDGSIQTVRKTTFFNIFLSILFSGRQVANLDFIKREYNNLMELQDCTHVVHLYKGCERQVSKFDLNVDLLFEYCPYDLKKTIQNRRINFRLSEIKSFLRQMLLGLREIHGKSVRWHLLDSSILLCSLSFVINISDFTFRVFFSFAPFV